MTGITKQSYHELDQILVGLLLDFEKKKRGGGGVVEGGEG